MRELYDETLSDSIDHMKTPERPLTDAQKARIIARTFQKAEESGLFFPQAGGGPGHPSVSAQDNPGQGAKKKPRHMAKRTGALLVAAAVLCAVSVTAVAAGPTLLKMMNGKIGFFDHAPAHSEVQNPADTLHGEYPDVAVSMESYNTAVGQTAESNGVSITLDTISMDAAAMNVFFTITGDQAVKGVLDPDDYAPEWSQLWMYAPYFYAPTVNGEPTAVENGMDFYRVDDNTLKLWKHYNLTAAPQGETVTVALKETRALDVEGSWSFTVHLDGASVRAGSRGVKAGAFETAADPLRLQYLAFGPVGGVIAADIGASEHRTENGGYQVEHPGWDPSNLYITDDTGKVLYETADSARGTSSVGTRSFNLSAPAPGAASVTLTPVLYDAAGKSAIEKRAVTAEEMKNGAQIDTSPLGGYTVRNYKVEGSAITFQLVPYGWCGPYAVELIAEDDGIISYAKSSVSDAATGEEMVGYHSGLLSSTADPQTGIITVRHDYYAATEDELNQITEWRYYYSAGYSLDTAHAVTLPLESLQEN